MNAVDIPMTIGHYLNAMDKLMRQWTPANYRDPKRQRLYLKDIDCPEPWHQHLQRVIPQTLFYLNDCVGERGGLGAIHERNIYNELVLGKGVGPAGDLMSNLPPEMRAENMMCYIGHEGTYTPAHREMCASLGQNIMVETSATDKGEKSGSSIWFMTESKDREVVSEYFLSMLGHDIEVESHFAQINAWKKAPFPVYIVEQKVGDFILIPPLAPHQVWNRGTRTMKVAWNRTTVETLELALHEALPRARMVCRDEQYKNKAIIYYSLLRYSDQLKRVEQAEDSSLGSQVKDSLRNTIRVRQLKKDFKRLFSLYAEILVSEMFSKDLPKEKHMEFLPFDSNVTCSYCRCNIFNRFLTCKTCIGEVEGTGEEDTYDICMECYAMGRSCGCVSNLTWVEQWQWRELTGRYDEWRALVIANDGFVDDSSPPTLDLARTHYGKKPVAQICQEQLKRRPWRDISKPLEIELSPESEPEPEVDDEGRLKKRRGSRRKSQGNKAQKKACHICKHRDWNWKLAFCTTCPNAYCYGTLWRAFDLKPQTVMEDPNWQCPKCLNICSCGRCRRDSSQNPYRPKGTLLGHDTKRVADPRSVESLVDFSRTNLTWLSGEGDDDPQTSLRMQKLMEKAQTEKAREETLEEDVLVEADTEQNNAHNSVESDSRNDMAIDPQLRYHGPNPINDADDPDTNYMGDDSTHTLTHLSPSDGLDHASPDRLVISNDGYADGEHRHYKHNGSHNLHASFAPQATMSLPESSYPDPMAPPRDRMMGIGYYQQTNDADKILFDHPDSSTPTGQDLALAYPKLPEESRIGEPAFKKRKAERMSASNKDEMDEAQAQYFQAQKNQKLADARKQGRYYVTLNQLEGWGSLIIKLPIAKYKEFLRHLQELDEGQTQLSHNPRSPRRSTVWQQRLSELDDNTTIVRSHIQGEVVQRINQEGSDEEDSIILATRALQRLAVPPAVPKTTTDDGLQRSGKTCDCPPKALPELDREFPSNKSPLHRSHSELSPIPKPRINPPSSASSQKIVEEGQQISVPSSTNAQKGRPSTASRPREKVPDPDIPPTQLPDSVTTPKQVITVRDEPTKEPAPVSKNTPAGEDRNLIDKDDNTLSATPALVNKYALPRINKPLSEEYLKAKEEAFRMFEAELEEEEAAIEHKQKASPLKAQISPPRKAASIPSKSTNSPVAHKSLPKGPPGQLMSMAERQALQGKPFKIVGARSRTNHGHSSTPTARSGLKVSSAKPLATVRRDISNNSENSGADGSSSSDDDESIPAIRPLSKKSHIESLADYEKPIVKPITGMPDGVRSGEAAVRMVK